jgi:hypothetical protein
MFVKRLATLGAFFDTQSPVIGGDGDNMHLPLLQKEPPFLFRAFLLAVWVRFGSVVF